MKDTIETDGSMSVSKVEAALRVADDLNGKIGPTGIAAWLRTVLVEDHLVHGETARAAEPAQQAIDELAALQKPRQEFTTRLAIAVKLAIAVAEAGGNAARVTQLEHDYAEVLARAGTREQKLRDEHGQLADYVDDFRPSSTKGERLSP